MKFICNTADLSNACQNVSRAASGKTAIPAIEGILITSGQNTLTLTGYDLEMGITTVIPSNVEENGSIVLNAHMLSDILRRMPGDTVSLESDSRQIAIIKSGEVKYQLIGINAEDYPELPSVSNGYPVKIDQLLLRDMIRKTIFAVAVKDSKAVHTGIKFEIGNNSIRLVAVDGVRLAIRNETINYSDEELSFVVPAKTLSEVVKLMSEEGGELNIGVGKRHIIFELEGYSIISRLLDGEFLKYEAAIPSVSNTVVKVNTRSLLDSIDRTSLIITDRLKSPVKCIFKENVIEVSSVTSIGSANDKIAADVQGEECTIGFNNRLMLEALRVCDTDEIKILLVGSTKPILICPPEGESFIFLVLPVRLKNED
ncbi:MAG: DNA polymerase III subunit beta [Clostridia bacterium]|nr:DNA polymerase III subunit beta [Clostridia bacterium]